LGQGLKVLVVEEANGSRIWKIAVFIALEEFQQGVERKLSCCSHVIAIQTYCNYCENKI
jgi:hypothetical protein